MKDRMLQTLAVVMVVIGSVLYLGSPQKALAQSTQKTLAIVNTPPCTITLPNGVDGNCTGTVSWPDGGFADANYAPICTATFIDNGVPYTTIFAVVLSQTATTITLHINDTTGLTTYTVNCVGVHN